MSSNNRDYDISQGSELETAEIDGFDFAGEEDQLNRRRALKWLSAAAGVFVVGCRDGSAHGGGSVIVPAPAPSPSPTPSPTPVPTPTPTPVPTPTPTPVGSIQDFARGANFASLEGTPDVLPGKLQGEVYVTPDYHFPYYAAKGFDHIRLQGIWERLQPRLNGALGEQLFDYYGGASSDPLRNPVNLVKHYLDLAQKSNLKVILDLCHNYGRRYIGYNGNWNSKVNAELGTPQLPVSAFVDYCVKLVQTFGSHPAVVGIELMNEPHDMQYGADGWRDTCQQAINGIRKVNSNIWIVVDGYGWASAEAWASRNPTIHTLQDPSNRIMWSAHQYFDANSSGTYAGGPEAAPSNQQLGVQRLAPFIQWLQQHGFQGRGHVGEFGAPDRAEWKPIVSNFIQSAKSANLRLTAHQDISYPNNPYTMNLFPSTDGAGNITGPDRQVVALMSQLR